MAASNDGGAPPATERGGDGSGRRGTGTPEAPLRPCPSGHVCAAAPRAARAWRVRPVGLVTRARRRVLAGVLLGTLARPLAGLAFRGGFPSLVGG